MRNKIILYDPELKEYARQLRKNSTLSEVILWQKIRRRALGVQFHRQVPMLSYIVDFYCHEIGLAIEIDGTSHGNKFFYDARRQGRLEAEGVKFIRFDDKDVKKNLPQVLCELKQTVKELFDEQNS